MTAPTVAVTAKLSSFGGPALAGVVITATADKDDNYQGLILRKTVTATTDTNGEAVFNLFPNALATAALPGLGTTGSTYRFTASVPNGWRMDVSAQVPNVACDLHSIVMADDAELPTPGEVAGAVRYDIAQTLTSPQQAQARANIGFDAAVRAVALTGLSLATATAVTAADSVLVAFGKAQAQITALDTAKANLSGAAFTGAVSATGFTGPLTGNVTGNVSGSAPAGSLAGTTLAANVVNASLNSITPTGGVLAVTGNVSATGSLQAGAGGDGALSSVRSDNTSATASGVNLSRGNATGTNVNISTTGDGANGVAAALLRFDGTEVMRWQPGTVAVTGLVRSTVADGVYGGQFVAGTGQIRLSGHDSGFASAAIQAVTPDGGSYRPLIIDAGGVSLSVEGSTKLTASSTGITVTGSISATATAETFISTAATTSPRSLHLANTGADVYFGIEGSSSGGFFTGSTAYATVVYSTQRVQTIIGGVKRTEVDSSGITVTGLTTTDTLRVNVTPTAETPTATHTAVFNINGTNYKFLCLVA